MYAWSNDHIVSDWCIGNLDMRLTDQGNEIEKRLRIVGSIFKKEKRKKDCMCAEAQVTQQSACCRQITYSKSKNNYSTAYRSKEQ